MGTCGGGTELKMMVRETPVGGSSVNLKCGMGSGGPWFTCSLCVWSSCGGVCVFKGRMRAGRSNSIPSWRFSQAYSFMNFYRSRELQGLFRSRTACEQKYFKIVRNYFEVQDQPYISRVERHSLLNKGATIILTNQTRKPFQIAGNFITSKGYNLTVLPANPFSFRTGPFPKRINFKSKPLK